MKRFIISGMLIFCAFNSFAQTKSFSGVLLDRATGLPIAWANIFIKSKGIGTVSNTEGQFIIRLPEGTTHTSLRISCIGYKSISIEASFDDVVKHKIYLEPDIKLLDEIVIKPIDAREFVLSAIKKIPVNYPAIPTMTTGFYRESLKFDSSNYIYISEGILLARKESYAKAQSGGQVKLIKARKKEFYDSLKRVRFYAGPHIIHRFDFVINRLQFIDENELSDYSYNIENITFLDGREIYEISFKPISSQSLFQGILLLDVNSMAFVSATYSLTKAGLKHYENTFGLKFDWLERKYLINYLQIKNKWTVQNIWQQGIGYDQILKNTVVYTTEFVATEWDTLKTAQFLYADRFQYGDFFIDKANNLDPAFWENFNILKEDSFIQSLRDKETNIKSLATDYSPASKQNKPFEVTKRKTRYSLDFASSVLFPNYAGSNVSLSAPGVNIFSFIDEGSPVVIGLYSALEIYLRKDFKLTLGSTSSFGKLVFNNASMGVGYIRNITIKTRPLRIIGGLGLSYNNLSLPIGTIEGVLNINGKSLSGEIEANMLRSYYAFQPSLKFSLELNRKLECFVGANFLFDFSTENKIRFKEKDNSVFTRKQSSVKTSDPSIDFRVNGTKTEIVPISISSFFLNTGVTFKYNR